MQELGCYPESGPGQAPGLLAQYNGEIGKIKFDFFARIWSKPLIFEYVKKVLFLLIFHGFLISMKKLKNRFFVKKRKKYFKW